MYGLRSTIAMATRSPGWPSCPPTRTAVNHLHSNPGTAEFGQCVKQQLCILSVLSTPLGSSRSRSFFSFLISIPLFSFLYNHWAFKSSLFISSLSLWTHSIPAQKIRAVLAPHSTPFLLQKSYLTIEPLYFHSALSDTPNYSTASLLSLHFGLCRSQTLMGSDETEIMFCWSRGNVNATANRWHPFITSIQISCFRGGRQQHGNRDALHISRTNTGASTVYRRFLIEVISTGVNRTVSCEGQVSN